MTGRDVGELYDRHARDLVGFFARRTRDPQMSLDLLGETFLAAFEARRSCRAATERERAAWLYRIAANKLTDYFRRGASERRARTRLVAGLRAPTEDEMARVSALGSSDELDERASEALRDLSDEQRAALHLRLIEDRSYPEVSAALGVTEAAARARVSRGLRALRRAMAGSEENQR